MCQSTLKLLNRYDERFFDVVLSFSQEIYVWPFLAGDDDFNRNNATFHSPKRLQFELILRWAVWVLDGRLPA